MSCTLFLPQMSLMCRIQQQSSATAIQLASGSAIMAQHSCIKVWIAHLFKIVIVIIGPICHVLLVDSVLLDISHHIANGSWLSNGLLLREGLQTHGS